MKRLNLLGKTFGRLTVIDDYESKNKQARYVCKCTCGNTKVIVGRLLITGCTVSCGCKKLEGHHKTHGLTDTSIYIVWRNINIRCYLKSGAQYKNWGGRGIINFWKTDFKGFYDYVSKLENYGIKGMSIDRINNDGNYEPNNLRWATRKQQNTNRTDNVIYKGEVAIDASVRLGGSRVLVRDRLKLGWTKEEAFTTPARKINFIR